MSGSGTTDLTPDTQGNRLTVLEHCCNCLTALSELDPDDSHASEAALTPTRPFIDQADALATLLDFVEIARIPNDWRFEDSAEASEDDDETSAMTRENCEKRLGKAKASAIRMIIHISWDIPYNPESRFWKRMLEWTAKGTEREDLVSCGLLSIGNGAKNGQSLPLSYPVPRLSLTSQARLLKHYYVDTRRSSRLSSLSYLHQQKSRHNMPSLVCYGTSPYRPPTRLPWVTRG